MDSTWVSNKAPAARRADTIDIDAAMLPYAQAGVDADSRLWYLLTRILKRHTTRAGVASHVHGTLPYLRWMRDEGLEFSQVTEDDAEDFVNDQRRQGHHPSTIYARITAGRTLYEEGLRKGVVGLNPFRFIKIRKVAPMTRTPAISKEDVEMTLAKIHEEFDDLERALVAKRDYALVLLIAWTAVRSIEVSRLRWGDFFLDRGKMLMRIQGKGNKTADVAVPDAVWEALLDWRTGYERTRKHAWTASDPVFASLSPRHRIRKPEDARKPLIGIEPAALSQVVHRRLADVGITGKRLRAHCLRATAATLAIAAGAQIQEVRELLRHESLQTTQGYIDFEKAKQGNAQDRLTYRLPGADTKPQ